MEIKFPHNGLREVEAHSDQPADTTREARNVRFTNRKNGRQCGSSRAGSKLWLAGTANGASKISRIESVIYARKKMTYAALADGSHDVVAQVVTPGIADCAGVVVDADSNVFALDGAAGIVKYNSELVQVFKLAVPIADKQHVCRALCVDDFGGVFVGVSSGGDFDTAKLWKFKQEEDNKTSKLWEIETHAYVERIVRQDALLYTLQNDTGQQKTWVVAYSRVDGAAPEEEWRFEVTYPGNDLCVSPKDASVFWTSEPNATRGFNPKAPQCSLTRQDWTPKQLYKWKQRIWSWIKVPEFDSLVLRYPNNNTSPSGLEILEAIDLTGNGRSLYADAKTGSGASGAADTGPTYNVNGIGGRPSMHFNGTNQSMFSVAPVSTDRAYRAYQQSLIPTYKGAQFVSCWVVKAPIELIPRTLMQVKDLAAASKPRGLVMNAGSGRLTGGFQVPGTVALCEFDGTAADVGSSATLGDGPSGAHGSAANKHPATGPRGPYGEAIITWICDGRQHDVFGTATRSQLRVNGQPVDRWQSAAWESLFPCLIGYGADINSTTPLSSFAGEISEIITLCDWDDENGALQRLVGTGSAFPPTGAADSFPDVSSAAVAAGIDGDVQRLEGYLAHEYGLSHLLPGPMTQIFTTIGAVNFVATNTVTVAGVAYTFQTVLAAANDVLVGTGLKGSLANLAAAINHTGSPGVDYYYSTVAHPTFFAHGICDLTNSADGVAQYTMRITARDPYQAVAVCNESTAAKGTWQGGVGAQNTTYRQDGANGNIGNHPHAYHYSKTSGGGGDAVGGGPPGDPTGVPGSSKSVDLANKYGVLGKLDAGGKLTWICASNQQNDGFGRGGIGYGCVANSAGEVYTVGPRQALVASPAIPADVTDYRKVIDLGASFKTSGVGTALTDPWAAAQSEPLYHYPRLAVDKFDNVFIPILDAPETVSLRVYQRQPAAAGTGLGVQLAAVTNITDDPQGYAVACDPRVPEYETDLSTSSNPIAARAQFVALATRKETGTDLFAVHRLGLVSSTPAGGSPRARVDLVASGTALKSITAGGAFTAISTPFSASADFVDSIAMFEKVVFTDGATPFLYDPKLNTVTRLKAKGSGQVPLGCQLVSCFNGRVMFARDKSSPHRWYAGEQGNFYGWDFDPIVPTQISAVSHTDPRIGPVPDIINAIGPLGQDSFLFGCQKSIWELLGDPAATNSRLQIVSGGDCGMAFGRSMARDGDNNLYWVGARGGFYLWENGKPRCLTDETIPRRMRDLDFGSNWVELVWDPRENAMKVFLCPFGAGGSLRLAYTWERRSGAIIPLEDSYGTATDFSRQPTCAKLIEGDNVAERVLLYGTEDGHVLTFDEGSTADDTVTIDAYVGIPLSPKDPGYDYLFTHLKLALAQDDGGCNFELFGSSIAEKLGPVRAAGNLVPGPNPTKLVRVRGRNGWLRLRGSGGWAFEEGSIKSKKVGKARAMR